MQGKKSHRSRKKDVPAAAVLARFNLRSLLFLLFFISSTFFPRTTNCEKSASEHSFAVEVSNVHSFFILSSLPDGIFMPTQLYAISESGSNGMRSMIRDFWRNDNH